MRILTPALILATLGILISPAHAVPPVNDNKADAIVLTGDSATGSANNVEATKESGDFAERTVWWKWTAPANGRVTMDSLGSGSTYIAMSVYLNETSSPVTGLVDNGTGFGTSKPVCAFPVTQGSEYLIGMGVPDPSASYAGSLNLSISLNRNDVVGSLVLPHAATMSNDSFASRKALTGSNVSAVGYNISATRQISEPAISGGSTLWWTYRPTANGRLTISTAGSDSTNYNSNGNFWKRVMIYMGTSLDTLRVIEGGSDSIQETITFPVTADTDYQISVGSYDSSVGSLVLTFSLNTSSDVSALNIPNAATMANDSYASRIALAGDNVSAIAYAPDATREDTGNEPAIAGQKTFWWTYQPTANGRLTLTTQGSDTTNYNSNGTFWKRVVFYMGTTLSGLQVIDVGQDRALESVTLPVTAGVTYVFSVGAYDSSAASLVLTLFLDKTSDVSALNVPHQATMANDSFANRITLTGNTVSAVAYAPSATREDTLNEPAISGSNTLWWNYRPTATGRLTVTTQGSDTTNYNSNGTYWKRVAIYQGSALQTLRVAAVGGDRAVETMSIPVTANTDYQISVGSYDSSSGSVVLTLSLDTAADVSAMNVPNATTMTNDAFANRVVLTGNNVSAIGYTSDATREALEPTATGERTIWWTWTSSVTGPTVLDFTGTGVNGLMASIWEGSTLASLTLVPRSNWTGWQTSFNAVAGQTYHLAVGTQSTSSTGSAVVLTVSGPLAKPIFGGSLQSRWLALGEPMNLAAPSAGASATYRWQKNGVFITGATGLIYSLPSVALANAGVYKSEARNALGTTLSGAANIGVMDTASRNVTVNEGATMKLTLPVAGPTGALSFRWMRNGLDMADGKVGTQTISGTGTATLSITGYGSANEGTYTCRVTMVNAADASTPLVRTSGDFVVGSFLRPVVANTQVPDCEVARQFTWQLTASNSPTSFAATGLPSGLKLNTSTGLITGTPTASSTGVTVKVTASNAAGAGPAQNFVLPISSLRAGLAATYAGVIDRDPVLNAQLGGTITTTVATSGSVTGTLRLGTFSHPLTGRVIVPAVGNATANLTIPRTGKPALMLSLVFAADGSVNGSLEDGTVSIAVTAGVNPWKTTNQPLSMAGLYNVLLDLPAAWIGDQSVPQGLGYMQMTVTGKTGAVSISGRTGDGIAFTNSVTVWADGRMPLFALLYSNKGSIRGLPQITVAGAAPAYADNSVGGTLDWQKTGASSTSDHTYSAGFGPIDLIPDGSKWVKPTTGTMLFGLPNQANNLRVEFTDGGIESVAQAGQISQTFQLLPSAVAVFNSATSGNPTGVTMKLTTSTGLFSGSFKLTDPKPAATGTQTRTVNYSGLLVSHLQEGYGWFALPGLATGSDVLCGQVLLKAP